MMVAKVKDTQLMFSYIIEASVIEQNAKDGGMS
jgi:hypothetical protein